MKTIKVSTTESSKERTAQRITSSRIIIVILMLFVGITTMFLVGPQSAAAACATPSPSYGTDSDISVSAPSSGTYTIWVRMLAPTSASNSLLLEVDGGSCYNVGGLSSMTTGSWDWVNYENGTQSDVMTIPLTQGTHTIELLGSEPSVEVDRIELLEDASCTPSNTGTNPGDNCAPTSVAPPTVSFTSPDSGSTVSGSNVTVSADAASAPGVTEVGLQSVVFEVDGSILKTLTTSPYTTTWDTSSATNGSHTLTVVATDTQGQSTPKTETVTVDNDTGCGTTAPSIPTTLAGTSPSPTAITLTWGASTPPLGCTITTYNVYENGTKIATPTTNTLPITGLIPDTIYNFTVSAEDSSGNTSSQTASTAVTTAADTATPSVPGSVTVHDNSATSVTLNWSQAADSVGAPLYYRIYRTPSGGKSPYASTADGASTYTDSSASAGTQYTYTVSAVDTYDLKEGTAAATDPVTVTTPTVVNTAKPGAPTNLQAELVTSDSVVLTWTASSLSTDGAAISSYTVYYSTGVKVGTTTTGTSYTDSTVKPSTDYKYYVVATDADGNSSVDSSTLSVTTQAGTTATCSPDLNGDGVVNIFDASILFSHWGLTPATCAQGDLNGDNVVNIFDASKLFSQWGDKE